MIYLPNINFWQYFRIIEWKSAGQREVNLSKRQTRNFNHRSLDTEETVKQYDDVGSYLPHRGRTCLPAVSRGTGVWRDEEERRCMASPRTPAAPLEPLDPRSQTRYLSETCSTATLSLRVGTLPTPTETWCDRLWGFAVQNLTITAHLFKH